MVTVPGPVIAVMAHPDDLELWAGGTLALHTQHAPVTGAVRSHDPQRDAEARAGARILGIDIELHPCLDAATIADLIHRHRPDVLLTHPLDDVHPDHRATAEAVLTALPDAHIATGTPRRLYTCDTYNSLTLNGPLHAPVIIDITTTYEQKTAALAQHRSQPITEHFGPMADNLSALWGARIGTTRAEAFRPLSILGRLPATAHL
ncbi:PIG-L family deacetylase [Streptomyces sp. NPDC004539]|uniref:PIG-L deacetylase family protein n=1 Tax=Streptomyces sp. NPDC004539 TaxID=3154280 RepID=UPI0033B0FF8A